jgi:hypothetical protein
MNRTDCIFLKKFWSDAIVAPNTKVAYSGGITGISGDQTAVMPATGLGPKSPAVYRMFPAAAANIAVSESSAAGGFYFYPDVAAISVMGTSVSTILTIQLVRALRFSLIIICRFPGRPDISELTFKMVLPTGGLNMPMGRSFSVVFTGWKTATIPSGHSLHFQANL